jgi:4-amino-4-deoxy-L-arabinose transferase-like glycosyltransferase
MAMDIIRQLKKTGEKSPLMLILGVAVVTRLLAAFFSRGFGMHDDHFLVIEPAQAWLEGVIVPGRPQAPGQEVIPDGHSLFYMGFHYLLFRFFAFIGLIDPQIKMLLVRLLHAAASVWAVWLTYRITERVSGRRDAFLAGLLMASFWFLPMLSVRNLVETFCIPFTLAGIWLIVKSESRKSSWPSVLAAGLVLGLSISIRFQLVVFAGGVGLVFLIRRKWLDALVYGFGVLVSVLVLQGWIDQVIWGHPFAEFIEYARYNMQAAYDYITGPWYNYILLFAGIFLPPVSLMLLFGYFRSWRKQLLIFLPSFLFLAFHSFYPNKQERFVFPIVPYLIMGGVIGWNSFVAVSAYWKKHPRLLRNGWVFFWLLNMILLIPVSFAYSKRSRVEAMAHLKHYPGIKVIVAEDMNSSSAQMLPRYYSGQWMQALYQSKTGVVSYMADSLPCKVSDASFVFFYDDKNLQARVDSMKKVIPDLEFEAEFDPGLIDRVLHFLNPVNRNETIFLYRNNSLEKKRS